MAARARSWAGRKAELAGAWVRWAGARLFGFSTPGLAFGAWCVWQSLCMLGAWWASSWCAPAVGRALYGLLHFDFGGPPPSFMFTIQWMAFMCLMALGLSLACAGVVAFHQGVPAMKGVAQARGEAAWERFEVAREAGELDAASARPGPSDRSLRRRL